MSSEEFNQRRELWHTPFISQNALLHSLCAEFLPVDFVCDKLQPVEGDAQTDEATSYLYLIKFKMSLYFLHWLFKLTFCFYILHSCMIYMTNNKCALSHLMKTFYHLHHQVLFFILRLHCKLLFTSSYRRLINSDVLFWIKQRTVCTNPAETTVH